MKDEEFRIHLFPQLRRKHPSQHCSTLPALLLHSGSKVCHKAVCVLSVSITGQEVAIPSCLSDNVVRSPWTSSYTCRMLLGVTDFGVERLGHMDFNVVPSPSTKTPHPGQYIFIYGENLISAGRVALNIRGGD